MLQPTRSRYVLHIHPNQCYQLKFMHVSIGPCYLCRLLLQGIVFEFEFLSEFFYLDFSSKFYENEKSKIATFFHLKKLEGYRTLIMRDGERPGEGKPWVLP